MKLSNLYFCNLKTKTSSNFRNNNNNNQAPSFDDAVQHPVSSTSFSTSIDYPISLDECCNRCLHHIKSELEGIADPMRRLAIRKEAFASCKNHQLYFLTEAEWQFVLRFISSEII
jgi:hypothetical protein